MSEGTNPDASNTLAGLAIESIRSQALSALRDDTIPGQLAAMSTPKNNDLATALLVASVIVEHAPHFHSNVTQRALELLGTNGLLQASDTLSLTMPKLPDWVYEQAIEEQDRRKAEVDRQRVEHKVEQFNQPDRRSSMLDLLVRSENGLANEVLTTQLTIRPGLAVVTASIVLEHSDQFAQPVVDQAVRVLRHFGQSTEPEAPLTITEALVNALPAELDKFEDDLDFATTVAGIASNLLRGLLSLMEPDIPSRSTSLWN